MKISVLNRKVHYWGSIIIVLPLLLIIGSGILLLLKKDISWIQPTTINGRGTIPAIGFDQLFKTVSTVKEARILSWNDITRIDIQPSKGLAKVTSGNNYEIQVDTETGNIMQVAFRRSDIIESLHDGTFFHDSAKYLVSLPTAVILFVLLISGVVLFFQPFYVKRMRKRKKMLKYLNL